MALLVLETTKNHKKLCLERREVSERLEFRVSSKNSETGAMNELEH